MRKRELTMFAIFVFLMSVISLGSLPAFVAPVDAAEKVIKLRLADMVPPTAAAAMGGQWWASEVEKRTGGRVHVECFFGGSLVGAYELLNAVKSGAIHVSPYLSGYHPDMAPLPSVCLFPLMNTGPLKQAMLAAEEWYRTEPALLAEFKKNNVKFLYTNNLGNQYLWSRGPIKSLGDLKGLRIRTFGPLLGLFQELGCSLVSVPVPEVYNVLERGAVDCTTQYLTNAVGGRYFEVTKYLNITELGHNCGAPNVMNLDTWNSLPPDIQAVIEKVNHDMIEKGVEMDRDAYNANMKTVKEHKMVIESFSPDEVNKMTELARTKVWEPYAAKLDPKGIPATEALKRYIQLVEKYKTSK